MNNYSFILLLFTVNQAALLYDYEISNRKFDWEESSFYCANSAIYQQYILFNIAFANPPKIIVTPTRYDLINTQTLQYIFTIIDITTTQFTAQIFCPSVARTWRFRFRWIAIDDQRIEVINCLKNVTGSSQVFQIPHFDPNALQGYVTFISLGFLGAIDFKLSIQSINKSYVTILYKANNTNMFQIGFQVVLGSQEAFILQKYYEIQSITSSSYYSSEMISKPSNHFLMLPIIQQSIDSSRSLRVEITQLDTTSTLQYYVKTIDDSLANIIIHQRVWINFDNQKQIVPFLMKNMISQSKFLIDYLNQPQIKLYISELNQTYISPFNSIFLIDSGIQPLNMLIQFQCSINQKISGYFMSCVDCTHNFYFINRTCPNNINMVNFHIALLQQDLVYQNISLNVSSTGFTMNQTIQNQYNQQTYTLGQLYLNNI